MTKSMYYKPGSQVIAVPENAEKLTENVSQKLLFKNAEIIIKQLHLKAQSALPEDTSSGDRFYVVLHGDITINEASDKAEPTKPGAHLHTLAQESLIYIPRNIEAAGRLHADTTDAVLLEVEYLNPKAKPQLLKLAQGTWVDEQFMFITKAQAKSYIPAHHDNTANRCLFINDDIEVLLSCIDVGGGADTHTHEKEDQCTYVIEPTPSKLLYYPKGVEHGGLKDMAERHDLVLMYFPPQGECLEI